MTAVEEMLLEKYLKLPDQLEAAIAGLDEDQLDLNLGKGWSIRQYVHHTVEGEMMWQLFLRAILGQDGIEFPIQWYFAISQDEWAERWASGKRLVGPTLALFRGSTASLAELLHNMPAKAWDHFGRVTWPGSDKETHLTVRDIVRMHLGHTEHHTADIQAIRKAHVV